MTTSNCCSTDRAALASGFHEGGVWLGGLNSESASGLGECDCEVPVNQAQGSTSNVKTTAVYPQPSHDAGGTRVVGQAGGMLLTKTAVVTGLTVGLSRALARWRKPFATHDPGKIVSDLAISLALGGDCLADAALLRSEPAVFGPVASDPTIFPAGQPAGR